MNAFRKLTHYRKLLTAARNIGVKYEHVGLVFDADNALRKVAWFMENYRPHYPEGIAGAIGPNGYGPEWDDVVSYAKLIRRYENSGLRKVA